MTARFWILSGTLAAMIACAPVVEEPVVNEEVVVLEAPAADVAPIPRCPEDDDGIGGTGCSVD